MSILDLFFILSLISVSNGEVFSSITYMEYLVPTQGKMLELFDTYLKTQEESLTQMKKRVESLRSEYETAIKDPEEYVSNPINSFRIIKQMHKDWNGTITLMRKAVNEFEVGVANLKTTQAFPDEDDMVGSVEAMLRLQQTYQLQTKDVSEGILRGSKCSTPLNSNDCFHLGYEIYKLKSYRAAQEWFTLALDKFDPVEYVATNKSVVMEFIAYNTYNLGDANTAIQKCQELLALDPGFHRLTQHIEKFQNDAKNITLMNDLSIGVDPHTLMYQPTYEKLCREALGRPPSVMKQLKCYYQSSQYPFTEISPFKLEEHYLEPYIVVFHDIITDDEIEYLKKQVRPNFQRAKVIRDTGDAPDKVRISMNAWLPNDYSPIVMKLTQRMEDMTGLVLKFAEESQIANYGIGGHYAEHHDFTLKIEKYQFSNDPKGNRLATILIYMSDVEQGGNTVFPYLGVSVRPVKGSAVFWYNLKLSGEGNTGTLHAACPVLKGSKWVLNKWIRLGGNEMERPCDLEYQDEGPCSDYPRLVETGLP